MKFSISTTRMRINAINHKRKKGSFKQTLNRMLYWPAKKCLIEF